MPKYRLWQNDVGAVRISRSLMNVAGRISRLQNGRVGILSPINDVSSATRKLLQFRRFGQLSPKGFSYTFASSCPVLLFVWKDFVIRWKRKYFIRKMKKKPSDVKFPAMNIIPIFSRISVAQRGSCQKVSGTCRSPNQ